MGIYKNTALFLGVFGFLHEIYRRRIAVQCQKHRRSSLKNLVGNALVDADAGRLYSHPDIHRSSRKILYHRRLRLAGHKGIDIKASLILLYQVLLIPLQLMPHHKADLLRIPRF